MAESYKYPYVPKEFYPATIFACKLIRESGWFNQSIAKAANYYKVDREELAEHVRKRQAAGQKGQHRKYSWFFVVGYLDYTYSDDCLLASGDYSTDDFLKNARTRIVKATTEDNARKQIHNDDDWDLYYGGEFFHILKVIPCVSKGDAEERADKFGKEEYLKMLKGVK